jgi:hypothetical protein
MHGDGGVPRTPGDDNVPPDNEAGWRLEWAASHLVAPAKHNYGTTSTGFLPDAAADGRVQANPAAKRRGGTELPGSRDQGGLQAAIRAHVIESK